MKELFTGLRDRFQAAPGPEAPREAPPGAAEPLPDPRALPNPNALPPGALAYLGDAVYELYVRTHFLQRYARVQNLHRAATGLVNAGAQARLLASLEPELSEDERAVVRRGRNAKSGQVPRSASVTEYRHATAFECLLGHLLLTGQDDRLLDLLERALQEAQRQTAGEQGSN